MKIPKVIFHIKPISPHIMRMQKSEFSIFYWKIDETKRKSLDWSELVKSTKKLSSKNKYQLPVNFTNLFPRVNVPQKIFFAVCVCL